MNRCGSFPLLSAPHSLFSIWTDLKRSEKIPGTPPCRWRGLIWPTGHSGLHQNSPQGLNISSIKVFDQNRDLEIPITLHPKYLYPWGCGCKGLQCTAMALGRGRVAMLGHLYLWKSPSTHYTGASVGIRANLNMKQWRKISTPLLSIFEPGLSCP